MWNLWYITFGLLFLTVIGLIIGFALTIRVRRYRKLTDDVEVELVTMVGYSYEERKRIKELRALRDKYHKIYINTEPFIGWVIAVTAGSLLFILLLCSILFPLDAKREANYFMAQKEYVEMAIVNGSELENVAITQIVIEQNQLHANAKASVQTYGAWSMYYGIDFSKLSPIEIKRE